MNFNPTDTIPTVVVIEPDVYSDDRGYFFETFQRERFLQYDLTTTFVQDNVSFSKHNVLRGLHYQLRRAQGKLVYAVYGEIYDVAVDIRRGSSTFGKWFGITLSSDNHRMLYVPAGFAHGFCVLSDVAAVVYKCTDYYTPIDEYGILWNDKTFGIDWPVKKPILSAKDGDFPKFKDIPEEKLPVIRP